MPAAIRRIFREESAAIDIFWTVSEGNAALPPAIREAGFTGSVHLNLADLEADLLNWSGWRDCFEHPEDYDWPGKMTLRIYEKLFPFQATANGDVIVFESDGDEDGIVMYLDHERGDFDRVVLGASTTDFVESWFSLGCPGPESWELAPFYDYEAQALSRKTDVARAWIEVLDRYANA